jgi:hypothetical protein
LRSSPFHSDRIRIGNPTTRGSPGSRTPTALFLLSFRHRLTVSNPHEPLAWSCNRNERQSPLWFGSSRLPTVASFVYR